MTDQFKKTEQNTKPDPATSTQGWKTPLEGVFPDMRALMMLMPGSILASGEPLPSDEETEAMFDNMPV